MENKIKSLNVDYKHRIQPIIDEWMNGGLNERRNE